MDNGDNSGDQLRRIQDFVGQRVPNVGVYSVDSAVIDYITKMEGIAELTKEALTEHMRQVRLRLLELQRALPAATNFDSLHECYNQLATATDRLAGQLSEQKLIDLEAVCRT